MREDAARPRAQKVRGEAARREAASLLETADQRMSKLRPWLRVSRAAGMKSQSKRKTHSDQLAEDGAHPVLRPQCPADEAINPNRQTGARRMKRSTPLAGQVFSGRRTNVKLQPPDWTEDEGPVSTPSFRLMLLAESYVESAAAAFPRGRPGESESSSGRTRATGIMHPGFYGRKPW